MAETALATWIAGALLGAYMFAVTMRTGLPESSARTSNLPSLVLFVHPLLALIGLALLLIHIRTNDQGVAWATFVALLLTAGGGAFMGARWAKDRRHATPEVKATVAEQQIPPSAVVAHGLLAAATLLFVLLSALRVTGD